ncbi:MAG: hypothetical protein JO129_04170 [Candidatus Dependentiae bacterium]|nr:hypothetical protein [Candidatus Dependentiae bacterium]
MNSKNNFFLLVVFLIGSISLCASDCDKHHSLGQASTSVKSKVYPKTIGGNVVANEEEHTEIQNFLAKIVDEYRRDEELAAESRRDQETVKRSVTLSDHELQRNSCCTLS